MIYKKRESGIWPKSQSMALRVVLILLLVVSPTGAATLKLYLDADMTIGRASGESIERGIRTALDEVGYEVEGHRLEVVIKDHRGNNRRSKANLEAFKKDPNGLAVFAGMHSPPLLANLSMINQDGILVLVPWAAAGPVTRPPDGQKNWVFRLSVDDSKSGFVIAKHAIEDCGFKRPALLLEQTGWGQSNERTMNKALSDLGVQPVLVKWFNWGIREPTARMIMRDVAGAKADCVFFVGNAPEGKKLMLAANELPEVNRPAVFSHWGITGGEFAKAFPHSLRESVGLRFIQTSFSFVNHDDSELGQNVLKRAGRLFPEIRSGKDVMAPVGFIHAYDITKVFIAAARQAKITGDVRKDREAIRIALESLESPVEGLIKTYTRPFGPYPDAGHDAHEALGMEDFVMGRYLEDNSISLVE